uniref:Uncharacterized protein n=1 Tax=Plectus sambesii TaxID=2011161 RepID=A0A914UY59_9BILA
MVILVPEYVDRASFTFTKSPFAHQSLSSPKPTDAGLNLLIRIVPSTNEPKCVSVLLPSTRSHSTLTRNLAAALEIHWKDIIKMMQVEDGVEKLLNDDADIASLRSGSTVHVVSKNAMEKKKHYLEGREKGLGVAVKIFIGLLMFTTFLLAHLLYTSHSNADRVHVELSNRINTLEQNLVILLNGAATQNSKTSDRVEQLKNFVDSKLIALSEVVLQVKDGVVRALQKGAKADGAKKSKQVCREAISNENDD